MLKRTARGNFLLRSDEPVIVDRRVRLFHENKLAAVAFDTIGKVEQPFFLAQPAQGVGEELVGKWLETAALKKK